jgi:hypothetical protein
MHQDSGNHFLRSLEGALDLLEDDLLLPGCRRLLEDILRLDDGPSHVHESHEIGNGSSELFSAFGRLYETRATCKLVHC